MLREGLGIGALLRRESQSVSGRVDGAESAYVDADDVTIFLADFGRDQYYQLCTHEAPCNGDTDCDGNVDADDVTMFLEDFGREENYNPCPACEAGNWCSY